MGVETGSDLGVKIILNDQSEIHEMFASGLYSSERVLINAMADNDPASPGDFATCKYVMRQEEAALSWKTDTKTRK